MTGIGFTLGLLCGLLMQLPADGLPASDNLNLNIISDASNHHVRARRSAATEGGDPGGSSDSAAQHEVSANNGESNPPHSLLSGGDLAGGRVRKQAFQSPPNPVIAANPFVSGAQDRNNGGGETGRPEVADTVSGHVPAQAERGGSGGEGPGDSHSESRSSGSSGQPGSGNQRGDPPQPLPHADGRDTQPGGEGQGQGQRRQEPVTSFTLRLKKTGQKVVVDSASQNVQTVPDDKAKAASASAGNSGASPGNSLPFDRIVTGVLWSPELEQSCPNGFNPRDVAAWRRKARGMQVVGVDEGCGRMQNRLVTFRDASKACARYRLNTDQIQGEVYSYYLARLLNVTNLPPAVMLPVDSLSDQWRAVHLDMSLAQWADGRLVVLTQWLDHLTPSHIPHELREDNRELHPTRDVLGRKTPEELCDLLQWSDLIVFDYLTANLDRLVNNMFNRQWNADMMNNPAHNLERTKDGSLVFLDNESGLFHGYRLLDKYHDYHESLLDSLCVFRERTVRAVKVLHRAGSVGEELQKLFVEGESHHRQLPSIPDKNVRVLKDRLGRVYDQIVKCEKLYGQR
nr:hypothetical protein BaRGS_009342 [Batillaria attramentaria]